MSGAFLWPTSWAWDKRQVITQPQVRSVACQLPRHIQRAQESCKSRGPKRSWEAGTRHSSELSRGNATTGEERAQQQHGQTRSAQLRGLCSSLLHAIPKDSTPPEMQVPLHFLLISLPIDFQALNTIYFCLLDSLIH